MRCFARALILVVCASLMVVASAGAQMSSQATGGGACYECIYCWVEVPNCEPGQNCVLWRHQVMNGPTPVGYTIPYDNCIGDPTCFIHPTCGGIASLSPDQQRELEALVYLAALGDVQAVAVIMGSFPELASVRPGDQSLLIASDCPDQAGRYRFLLSLSEKQFAIATGGHVAST